VRYGAMTSVPVKQRRSRSFLTGAWRGDGMVEMVCAAQGELGGLRS
jgi:hypothetical protein